MSGPFDWRIDSVPGFWDRMAEARDRKLARDPLPVEKPHDACRRRKVKILLGGIEREQCAPCAARTLQAMMASGRSFMVATAERFVRDYGLCDRCFYPAEGCGCR